MDIPWYKVVEASTPITQGDIIIDCPIVGWKETSLKMTSDSTPEALMEYVDYFHVDSIIMTQACDLEQGKVQYVVLCPHYSLDVYQQQWEVGMRERKQKTNSKAWRSQIDAVRQGRVWNLSMLNSYSGDDLEMGIRIVDFHEIFSLPRNFLESWLINQGMRLRLLPPYREYLSQAFARFFMRIGLPVDIEIS